MLPAQRQDWLVDRPHTEGRLVAAELGVSEDSHWWSRQSTRLTGQVDVAAAERPRTTTNEIARYLVDN